MSPGNEVDIFQHFRGLGSGNFTRSYVSSRLQPNVTRSQPLCAGAAAPLRSSRHFLRADWQLSGWELSVNAAAQGEPGLCDLSSFGFRQSLPAPLKVTDPVTTGLWSQSDGAPIRRGRKAQTCGIQLKFWLWHEGEDIWLKESLKKAAE